MTNFFKNNIERILVVLVWFLLFAIPLLFGNSGEETDWLLLFKIWKEYSLLLLIFIINRVVLMPHLYFKKKHLTYFVSVIAIISIFSALLLTIQPTEPPIQPINSRTLTNEPDSLSALNTPQPLVYRSPSPHENITQPSFDPPMGQAPREFIPPFANLIIMSVLLIGFDSGLIFFSKWMTSEQNKLKAEKESIKNKMAFLQNQVSPHFFMNTLNNIHALVDIDTEEAKKAIIKLSHMMDYMLYESQSSVISLSQELDFINSYVELMKLRLTDDIDLILDIPTTIPPIKIPPLLTISFIENAFKYGISYENSSFIHIHYKFTEKELMFSIVNSLHSENKPRKNSGIGIDNARKRLDLLYENSYELAAEKKSDTFNVSLTIPL